MLCKLPLKLVVLVSACAALVSCQGSSPALDDDTPDPGGFNPAIGTLNLQVTGRSNVASVMYAISCDRGFSIEGDLDVEERDPPVFATILAVPADRCEVTLVAKDSDGAALCAGTTVVDVVAGETVRADVTLFCPDGGIPTGSIEINGRFVDIVVDACPVIHIVNAIPSQIPEDGTARLQIRASDGDLGDQVFTTLTASSGLVANPNASDTTFTCTEGGTARITGRATDGNRFCDVVQRIDIECTAIVEPPAPRDGPNQSQVIDILNGDRKLVPEEDLAIITPLLFQATSGNPLTTWSPQLLGLPTKDGGRLPAAQGGFVEIKDVLVPTETIPNDVNVGPLPFSGGGARVFNIREDVIVTLRSEPVQSPTTQTLEASQLDLMTGTFTPVFDPQTLSLKGSLTELHVADFNLDGFDDVLFLLVDGVGPAAPAQWYIATSTNVDDPSQGMTVAPVTGQGQAGDAFGDANGDGFVDLFRVVCRVSQSGAPLCTVSWVSFCPSAAPDTVCAGASGPALVVPPKSAFSVNANLVGGEANTGAAVAVGDFLGTGQNHELMLVQYNARLSADDAKLRAIATLWSFADDFTHTQEGTDLTVFNRDSKEVEFSQIEIASGPIDFVRDGDLAAFSLTVLNTQGQGGGAGEFRGIVWWDTQEMGLRTTNTGFQSRSRAFLYGLELGHFDVPTSGCTDSNNQPIMCPLQTFNLQIAVAYLNYSGNNASSHLAIIDVVGEDEDASCSTGFCLTTHDTAIETYTTPTLSADSEPTFDAILVSSDLQGRGVRLGAPTVSRQKSIAPQLVVASPPMHVDRLPIFNFDQNIFNTGKLTNSCNSGSSGDQVWLSVSDCDIKSCPTADAPIPEDVTCTMNFSLAANSGNEVYQTSLIESAGKKSGSSTDHVTAHSIGGSQTTSITAQEGIGFPTLGADEYSRAAFSESAGRTNSKHTDSITASYNTTTKTETFATTIDDTVLFAEAVNNVYRYPMIGITCSPSGGNDTCTTAPGSPDEPGIATYTVSAPNAPLVQVTGGATTEWFQPPWAIGNMFTYPTNCATLSGGLLNQEANMTAVSCTTLTELGSTGGSYDISWMSNNQSTTVTNTSHSIWNKDSLSITTGVGDVSKPGKSGFEASETGTFSYNRDKGTITNQTTTTTDSTGIETQWGSNMFWATNADIDYSTRMIVFGQKTSSTDAPIQDVSTDPFCPDPNNTSLPCTKLAGTDARPGFLGSAFTVGVPNDGTEGTNWWTIVGQSPYLEYVDLGFALPLAVNSTRGTTQPGEGNEPVTQCFDNGSSQKLSCAAYRARDTSFKLPWGTDDEYFYMRGFFFMPAPSAPATPQCQVNNDCGNNAICVQQNCIDLVQGMPSTPGAADSVVEGNDVVLSARIYNSSFSSLTDAGATAVKVQFYGQEWDATQQNRVAGQDSFLIETVEMSAGQFAGRVIVPDTDNCESACESQSADYNWTGVHTIWSTDGKAGSAGTDYLFWVLVWAEDNDGNVIRELPQHGVCPTGAGGSGGTAGGSGTSPCAPPCPLNEMNEPQCKWMNDVALEPYSNNLAFMKKYYTVLPKSSGVDQPLMAKRFGQVVIDSFNLVGPQRLNESLQVNVHIHAEGGPADGVTVSYAEEPFPGGRLVEHETIPYIAEGNSVLVGVSHTPTECGRNDLFIEVNDDRGFVTRARKSFDVPCDEMVVQAERELLAPPPLGGAWEDAGLTLTFEAPFDIDLASARLWLERVLQGPTGEEHVHSRDGLPIRFVALDLSGGAQADRATYVGDAGGTSVKATLTEDQEQVLVRVELVDAEIFAGLYCASPNPKPLRTRLAIVDERNPPLLVEANEQVLVAGPEWQCR